jgi:hypothetical protein
MSRDAKLGSQVLLSKRRACGKCAAKNLLA